MAITNGSRLGAYEILTLLGSGGMGEVYRARDTKLGRDVAIKVLPDTFTHDPERLARFRREAQVLASLNHPHIGAIYGLEEANGQQFLVLELVDGESLNKRIARGSIPLDESLAIAKQIAEALKAAHERGIVHRDLKPANIALTIDGTVKVLDFGLAKATEPSGSALQNVADSPIITTPAMMTGVGVILGTTAYMSPEQAKGKPADKRSDIWAFGCVLYEMLTAKRAFEGDDVAGTLAFVLTKEPEWSTLPVRTSHSVRRLLRRCLEKDRRRRLADIADARLELEEVETPGSHSDLASRLRTGGLALLIGIAIAALSGAVIAWMFTRQRSASFSTTVVRLDVALPTDQRLFISPNDDDLAISHDGARIAYLARKTGDTRPRIFIRELRQSTAKPLDGTEGARNVFFSPDGTWLGFFADDGINKIRVDGGAAVHVAGTSAGGPRGASWADDDTIIFSVAGGALRRVSAAGGPVAPVAAPDRAAGETSYAWPDALPDRTHALLTILSIDGHTSVAVRDLTNGSQKTVIRDGTHGRYVSTGHIVFEAGGTLWAAPFDTQQLSVTASSFALSERPIAKTTGGALFDVSRTGTLVYASGTPASNARQLVWFDRTGREEIVGAPPRAYWLARISPDGQNVAIDVRDQQNDIWIWNFSHQTLTRFTFDPGPDQYPVWSHDSRRIVFSSSGRLLWRPSDGSGVIQRLTNPQEEQEPYAFTPDEKSLLVREQGISIVTLQDGRSRSVIPGGSNAALSSDGRFVAFDTVASGRREIFVRPFPATDEGGWQVSQGGGTKAVWSPDGKELFYLSPNNMLIRVPIEGSNTFSFRGPQPLLPNVPNPATAGRPYDIAPDGRRFLFIRDVPDAAGADDVKIGVALNWASALTGR